MEELKEIFIKIPQKEIELRSEEVQDIMTQIPSWILRRGITLLFGIVILLLIGSWFFKYPDIVSGQVTITSLQPPAPIIARATGKIDIIFVQNNDLIVEEQPLASIQNPANTMDMLALDENMKKWERSGYNLDEAKTLFPAQRYSLGNIQSAYASFLNNLNDYTTYKQLNYYQQKITSQKKQLNAQYEYFKRITNQNPVIEEQYKTSKIIFQRDSVLFNKKVISENEFDVSKNSFLQQKQSYLSHNASLKQSEIQLMQGEGNLLDLEKQAFEIQSKYELALHNATEELNAQIKMWKRDYLLQSPINGRVSMMGVWSNNQNVNTGDPIFTVSPTVQNQPTAKALIPVQGAGKMGIGQRVNVRINNFPDQEFGYLIGKVTSISTIPTSDGFYVVQISFPNGMKTNYDKVLPITQQMIGTADVITKDIRFIERIFMPLKKILKNQI